ncbi:hypothetical protein [Proteus phage RP7]|nr:hypothetical protein [Proteus phage RP7]
MSIAFFTAKASGGTSARVPLILLLQLLVNNKQIP